MAEIILPKVPQASRVRKKDPEYKLIKELLSEERALDLWSDRPIDLADEITLVRLPKIRGKDANKLWETRAKLVPHFEGQKCSATPAMVVRVERFFSKKTKRGRTYYRLTTKQEAHLFEHLCLNYIAPLAIYPIPIEARWLSEEGEDPVPLLVLSNAFKEPEFSSVLILVWSWLHRAILTGEYPTVEQVKEILLEQRLWFNPPPSIAQIAQGEIDAGKTKSL